jgi:hypothetical protein
MPRCLHRMSERHRCHLQFILQAEGSHLTRSTISVQASGHSNPCRVFEDELRNRSMGRSACQGCGNATPKASEAEGPGVNRGGKANDMDSRKAQVTPTLDSVQHLPHLRIRPLFVFWWQGRHVLSVPYGQLKCPRRLHAGGITLQPNKPFEADGRSAEIGL